ncbi:hypothetical protein [Paenibacillus cisolokensis]|uniref:hypothetical protein n=1 Tax=Paenibacillus cisolokensis TaxID=1658519 RepID=UPI0035570B39
MRQLDRVRRPPEQQDAKLLLQLGQLLAERRLRDMQLFRRPGKFLSLAIWMTYCSWRSSIENRSFDAYRIFIGIWNFEVDRMFIAFRMVIAL